MTSSSLPAQAPRIYPETKPFWDATLQGKLLLPRCRRCQTFIWYPKTLCSPCGSMEVDWVESAGTGTVYTFTIMRATRGAGPFGPAVPYVIAYVELDEGPRVMTNIVGCNVDDVAIGQRVRVQFDDTGEGAALPRFRPA